MGVGAKNVTLCIAVSLLLKYNHLWDRIAELACASKQKCNGYVVPGNVVLAACQLAVNSSRSLSRREKKCHLVNLGGRFAFREEAKFLSFLVEWTERG